MLFKRKAPLSASREAGHRHRNCAERASAARAREARSGKREKTLPVPGALEQTGGYSGLPFFTSFFRLSPLRLMPEFENLDAYLSPQVHEGSERVAPIAPTSLAVFDYQPRRREGFTVQRSVLRPAQVEIEPLEVKDLERAFRRADQRVGEPRHTWPSPWQRLRRWLRRLLLRSPQPAARPKQRSRPKRAGARDVRANGSQGPSRRRTQPAKHTQQAANGSGAASRNGAHQPSRNPSQQAAPKPRKRSGPQAKQSRPSGKPAQAEAQAQQRRPQASPQAAKASGARKHTGKPPAPAKKAARKQASPGAEQVQPRPAAKKRRRPKAKKPSPSSRRSP